MITEGHLPGQTVGSASSMRDASTQLAAVGEAVSDGYVGGIDMARQHVLTLSLWRSACGVVAARGAVRLRRVENRRVENREDRGCGPGYAETPALPSASSLANASPMP